MRWAEQRVPPDSASKATRGSVAPHSTQRSTTGRNPSIAEPTAMPTIVSSAIGVSSQTHRTGTPYRRAASTT